MTFADILVPTYTNLLGALSAWLTKAEAQRSDGAAEALLVARLAPDMFPLATQVRFACVQAQEGLLRLYGQSFPPELKVLLDEGRNAANSRARWPRHRPASAKPWSGYRPSRPKGLPSRRENPSPTNCLRDWCSTSPPNSTSATGRCRSSTFT